MKTIHVLTLLKGLIVGGTMLVPGVSGGSMAIVLGIYDKLIHAVSALTRLDKAALFFLCLFSLGGAVGIVLFAKPLLHVMETYPIPTSYFFLGAVAGSIPIMFRQGNIAAVSPKTFVYILIGAGIVTAFAQLPMDSLHGQAENAVLRTALWFVTGFVASIALILPGISVSYLLYLLGIYDQILLAIGSLAFSLLVPLGSGVIVGILATTKLLEKAMNRHPEPTYLIILGFVLGSMWELFPGIPLSSLMILTAVLSFLAGFAVIYTVSKKEFSNT